MNPEAVYKRIDDLANQIQSQQIEIFRWLHQHPELAYHEFQTGQFIRDYLEKLSGVEITYPIAKTGVKAVLNNEIDGSAVALRADFDALPVKEETGLSYASNVKTIMDGRLTWPMSVDMMPTLLLPWVPPPSSASSGTNYRERLYSSSSRQKKEFL